MDEEDDPEKWGLKRGLREIKPIMRSDLKIVQYEKIGCAGIHHRSLKERPLVAHRELNFLYILYSSAV